MSMPVVFKQAALFSHATSAENIDKILRSGKIYPLAQLARKNKHLRVNVEPNYSRARETMSAADAALAMEGRKDIDSIFLAREGYIPSYGEYVIVKDLKSPKPGSRINLVPNEYKTRRPISVMSNAQVYVPDHELEILKRRHPDAPLAPLSAIPVRPLNTIDAMIDLPGKVKRSISKAAAFNPELDRKIRRTLGRDAIMVGSTGLGINTDSSDMDYFYLSKDPHVLAKKRQQIMEQFPELSDSPNSDAHQNRLVLLGNIGGNEVNIGLGSGEKAQVYRNSFLQARDKLTPERCQQITQDKQRLKDAWLLPHFRYKRYKRALDKELGIERY